MPPADGRATHFPHEEGKQGSRDNTHRHSMQDAPQSLVLRSNRIDGMAGAMDAARAAFRLRLGAMDEGGTLPAPASSMLVSVEPNAHSSFALQVTPFEMEAAGRDASGEHLGGTGGLRLLVSTGSDASGARQVYDLWRFVGMGTPAFSTILSTTVANIDTLNVTNLIVNGSAIGLGGGGGGGFSGYTVPHWSTNHLSAGVASVRSLSTVMLSSNTVEAEWVYGRVLQTSDARLKTDVEAVENGLSILRALRPVFFNWRDGGSTTRRGLKDLGFVAQELEQVLPHVVACADAPPPGADPAGGGLRRVNYAQLTALLAAGVQEQATQVEALQCRVASVEARLQNVEAALLARG